MDPRALELLARFVRAQRRCSNPFALDGLADEVEAYLAKQKELTPCVA
jgi:hypothetical protein